MEKLYRIKVDIGHYGKKWLYRVPDRKGKLWAAYTPDPNKAEKFVKSDAERIVTDFKAYRPALAAEIVEI